MFSSIAKDSEQENLGLNVPESLTSKGKLGEKTGVFIHFFPFCTKIFDFSPGLC